MSSRPLPDVPGVIHREVDLGDFRAHVAEAGTGEPLVLLHGWPQHWYEWRDVIGPLAEFRRVICPDLRGFGWSETPGRGYDPRTFASDLVALLDAEGIDRVDLIGHDWGGYAGFLVGLDHPERLRRFIALNILVPFTPASPRALASFWRFWYQWVVAAPIAGPWVARSIASPLTRRAADWLGGDAWDDETREIFLAQFREPARARATTALYRFAQRELLAAARGRYRGSRLTVPTRLIFGTADRALDYRLLDGIEHSADDLEVELVEGAGHLIADERPELVVDRARSFFG